MSPPRETTDMMNWLREDLRDGIRECRDDLKEGIAEIRAELSKDLEKHAKTCPALSRRLELGSFGTAGATVSSSIMPRALSAVRIPTWVRVFAPILLSMAIGLVGFGFYMGSGGDADATTRAIRAMSDTTAKLAADLEKIKAAVDAGEN
jgi:hypothetical protein